MNSYSENLFDAIEIIAQDKIDKANLNKTIQATIVKTMDSALGKYKVKYQDSYFYVYTMNSDIKYLDGCSVYVLIPNGDFNQDKFIISAVDKTKIQQQTALSEKDKYEIVGCNCANQEEEFGICSYQEDGDILLLYDKRNNLNLINLNERDVEEYLKNSSYLSIGGDFRTDLNSEQQIKGNYGLVAEIVYLDEINNEVIKKYVLDINSFISNPYKIKSFTTQKVFFENSLNMQYINKIYIFCKDFLNTKKQDLKKDIFCKNISLCGAIQLDQEEALKTRISLDTPKGNYFILEDGKETSKEIKAIVKIKNQELTTYDSVNFYWFKENDSIQISDLKYCYYGGNGWECLNQKQGLNTWIPASNILTIKKEDLKTKRQKYKCVAVINENSYSNTIVFTNYGANLEITLQSDENPIFFYDIGSCVISCLINGEKKEDNNYKYTWSYQTKDGWTQLTEKGNQLEVSAKGLDESVIIGCSVYYDEEYLGSTSFSIYNFKTINNLDFTAKIENGDLIYQYDEAGLSPAAESLEDPIEIKPFKCSLYNSSGDKIDDKILSLCDIEWTYPKEKTMLKEEKSEKEFSYYKLENIYNQENINNSVSVKVNFEGNILTAETSIKVLKQGDLGTNGTHYSCKLVPNTTFNNFNEYPMFLNGKLNFQLKEEGKWFNVQLWKDGNKIFEGFDSGQSLENSFVKIKWDICGNKYNSKISDMSSFYIDENGLFNYNDYFYPIGSYNSPVNIIKAEITYKEQIYYITQPIITARTNFNYSVKINKNSGFNFVKYNSEGRSPHFKDRPFEIELKRQNQTILNYNGFKIEWKVLGQVYNIEEDQWKDIVLLEEQEDSLEINQKHFLPAEEYFGECLSPALEIAINTTSGSLVGQIHIPIHYYLNKQSVPMISGWDGNSIQLDKDGGYILTPQIGAGKKEEDNSFTGMLMGRSKSSDSSIEKIGLLGYDKGEQSLFLDAETGSAILGKAQGGQIIIDPENEKGSLYSHNYWKKYNEKGLPVSYQDSNLNREGMMIDLTNAKIQYGNGKLNINSDGKVFYGEILSSDGILNCVTSWQDWKDCYAVVTGKDYIELDYKGKHPEYFPEKLSLPTKYYPGRGEYYEFKGIPIIITIPAGFTIVKAIINIRYRSIKTEFANGIDLSSYGSSKWSIEEKEATLPNWLEIVKESDNIYDHKYIGYRSLRDGVELVYMPPETVMYEDTSPLEHYFGVGFDTSKYSYMKPEEGISLWESPFNFPNITEDHSNEEENNKVHSLTADFTEQAKKYFSKGKNFLAICAKCNMPEMDVSPYTWIDGDENSDGDYKESVCPSGYMIEIESYGGLVAAEIVVYGRMNMKSFLEEEENGK